MRFRSRRPALWVSFPGSLFTACPHLPLELLDGLEIRQLVRTQGRRSRPGGVSSAALQLRVVSFQLAHPLQVAGQVVVQERHGLLLIAIEGTLKVSAVGTRGAGAPAGRAAAAGLAGAG